MSQPFGRLARVASTVPSTSRPRAAYQLGGSAGPNPYWPRSLRRICGRDNAQASRPTTSAPIRAALRIGRGASRGGPAASVGAETAALAGVGGTSVVAIVRRGVAAVTQG